MKIDVLVAKLFAILLTCCGALLLYYTIEAGEELEKMYPFFLFVSLVLLILGVIGLLSRLKG
ncbi:MAG: hypothetical protein QXK24_06940 [Ignisphaera sp.]